jgi:hypothetical protein
MKGIRHVPVARIASVSMAGGLLLALLPMVTAATTEPFPELPRCADLGALPGTDGRVVSPWSVELDEDGVVSEHRLVLRRGGADVIVRTGRRGFALQAGAQRMLIGERFEDGTDLVMIDIGRACRLWTRRLDRLAYPLDAADGQRSLRLSLHRTDTRAYEGDLSLAIESGASSGVIDGVCISECEPNDGDVSAAAYEPAGPPQPVPSFPAGGWPQDTRLSYHWGPGTTLPGWVTEALAAAADDAFRTAISRAPRFIFRSDADDKVSYTGSFPSYCSRSGIACAARSIPSFWGVWLRPHGTDFAWGTLRWCQKDSTDGCFDLRRVMLHELGHIAGLHHPSSAGFTLGAHETVMHAISPAKPKPGSARHAFGRCDVATLQELYDTPDNKTAISTCNDVATQLTLTAAKSAVNPGEMAKLIAELRIDDKSAYGRLAGEPLNGRSVRLRYRRAGSDDAWTTTWMKSLYSSGRYELSIAPPTNYEFKATFAAPEDEGLRFSQSEVVKVKVRS